MVHGVKWTFYHFPYEIPWTDRFRDTIKMPDLLTLAAMKAFAIGDRAKWKDYVDFYFILSNFHSLDEIIKQAERLFQGPFNGKLLRQQLAFFDDINYSEIVEYLPGFEVPDKIIKEKLIEFSLSQ